MLKVFLHDNEKDKKVLFLLILEEKYCNSNRLVNLMIDSLAKPFLS